MLKLEPKKIKILHITPHFGGGVGKVILNYLTKVKNDLNYQHKAVCLDYCNKEAKTIIKKHNLILAEEPNQRKLIWLIKEADIVIVHWWNHPLLYDFLVKTKIPPCRIALWSHISGFAPPYIFTKKILKYPDFFIFTTPISFQTEEVRKLNESDRKKIRVIWSTGGIDKQKTLKPQKHRDFIIGYIGTVDYAKMHRDFLKICKAIKNPKIKFMVCGGPNENKMKIEAKKMGLQKKVEFTGKIKNINRYLSRFDLFGYPLSPSHYGSCDQVLAESMAAGVVPIVLANRMEKTIVKNNINGIVAKTTKNYIEGIYKLYRNKILRDRLSNSGKEYANKTFSLERMEEGWNKTFKELMKRKKTSKKWKINNKKILQKDIFLESIGDYAKSFIEYKKSDNLKDKEEAKNKITKLNISDLWKADTRGSVHHYHHFFPHDRDLAEWSFLMKNNE